MDSGGLGVTEPEAKLSLKESSEEGSKLLGRKTGARAKRAGLRRDEGGGAVGLAEQGRSGAASMRVGQWDVSGVGRVVQVDGRYYILPYAIRSCRVWRH